MNIVKRLHPPTWNNTGILIRVSGGRAFLFDGDSGIYYLHESNVYKCI